jgi:hypothetical protein
VDHWRGVVAKGGYATRVLDLTAEDLCSVCSAPPQPKREHVWGDTRQHTPSRTAKGSRARREEKVLEDVLAWWQARYVKDV